MLHRHRSRFAGGALFPALFALAGSARPAASAAPKRPNILLILADDLGWSDLGCYGSEIRTPHLDALAKNGLRFTHFYNSARCSPTRASLLTGVHPHQAGFPNLSGVLSDQCVTQPEVLKPAGYRTFMVGKWHLSRQSDPVKRGFDEFYGMLGGFNTCWEEKPHFSRLPEGRLPREYAPGRFYSTDVFGDYSLDFLRAGAQTRTPWMLYLAFNAPHFPLHAPEADIARYEKIYAQGWDRIREQRLAKQKRLGLMPKNLGLTPRGVTPGNRFNQQTGWANKEIPTWDSLPEDRRADLARRMAVYAAMVDRMDQNIGRITEYLKQSGQLKNTLIMFLSDNGACAEWDPWGFDGSSGPNNVLHRGEQLQEIGGPKSYVSYGSGWANASNTPFRLFKHYGHEGGINTPMIVHWPAGLKTRKGSTTTQPGHITDVMPTILEATGSRYPAERDGRKPLPLEGRSLVPALRGNAMSEHPIFMEHEDNRAVRMGPWKLVALEHRPWELYNLDADPTEMNDLAAREPERVRSMSDHWQHWAVRCSVMKPESVKSTATGVPNPQIAGKPLSIGCDVDPLGKDGVILAQGGNRYGYALHLRDGRPVFTVKIDGRSTVVTSEAAVVGPYRIEALLREDGSMALRVNGRQVAAGRAPGLIPVQPQDELTIGEDTLTAVGDYTPPHPLRGRVTNVKIIAGSEPAGPEER